MTLLSIEHLDVWYGRAQALHGVTLQLAAGETIALLGRNGAGKSTTLRALMGLVSRRCGSIRFNGHEVIDRPTHEIARLGLGWVPEDRRIFTDLTVEENLLVGCRPPRPGLVPWSVEKLYGLFPNLADMRKRQAAHMSGGEQQMLTIARTLMGNPIAVLLDEPAEGLAPRLVEEMATTITRLKRDGVSILLSEPNLWVAQWVCDRAVILEGGKICFSGTMADLRDRPEIQSAHLAV